MLNKFYLLLLDRPSITLFQVFQLAVFAPQVLTWLGYSNSSFNPIIYSIFNSEFREAFRKILTQRLPLSSLATCCSRGRGGGGGGEVSGRRPGRQRRGGGGQQGQRPLNGAIHV